MIAGLAVQVVSLGLFMVLCINLALRVRKQWGNRNMATEDMYTSKQWKGFLIGELSSLIILSNVPNTMTALGVATLLVFVRCVFRCAELSGGFNGDLFNDEVAFMILEGMLRQEVQESPHK